MKTRMPTSEEIAELTAFLPRLYAESFTPIKRWGGGTKAEDGAVTVHWPEYDEVVGEFFGAASRECWIDYGYRPETAALMLENIDTVANANLARIKTMLTYCVRGERFCDGHWAAMIEGGQIRRLLQRLAELASEKA